MFLNGKKRSAFRKEEEEKATNVRVTMTLEAVRIFPPLLDGVEEYVARRRC